jgi:hypothetical protein
MFRTVFLLATLLAVATAPSFVLPMMMAAQTASTDPRLQHAFRRPERNGWTFVHLEGTPSEIGFQHGYLLAPEIEDALKVIELEEKHNDKKDCSSFVLPRRT